MSNKKEHQYSKSIADFDAVRLSVASPEHIMEWSHGEVLKPETINYRTQKPEKDGLFCEKIFGPSKDYECYCGKYKGIHHRGVTCDRCGVLVVRSVVRRERMGHITLAVPATHKWFLRGTPSSIGLVLDMTIKNLEKVIYFASWIVKDVDADARDKRIADIEAEAEAAHEAVKKRFEKMAEEEDADVKKLAQEQTKEIDEIEEKYQDKKAKLEMLKPMNLISEGEFMELEDEYKELIDVGIGAQAVKDLLKEIDMEELIEDIKVKAEETRSRQRKKKLIKRLKKIEGMHNAGIRPEWMVLTELPVIPPDLRPMVQLTGGRFATSDLNDLYRRVINRNNRLKKLMDLNAPEVIQRNEMRMLQESVDALINNSGSRGSRVVSSTGGRRRLKSLSDMLKGKQGRFRQNLLGKRVDYSGRSVIVAGPDLRMDQCGLPKMMALELFKPFVIGNLIEAEVAHNVKAAARMIESGEDEVWDALEEAIQGKYVLLNRAPTLHRLGVQAFKPVLIEGKAIQLHALVMAGFNADFDGDQMAVHLPLSEAAQAEAKQIMAAEKNMLKPADGSPILNFSQDMVLGLYYMTYDKDIKQDEVDTFVSVDEVLRAFDEGHITLHTKVKLEIDEEIIETTAGRVVFNDVLPEDFPFQNMTLTKKEVKAIVAMIVEQYKDHEVAKIADNIKDLAFNFATVSGISTAVLDFNPVENKEEMLEEGEKRIKEISEQYENGFITEEERVRLTIETWQEVNKDIETALASQFEDEDSSTSATILSGARGDINQLKQLTGSVGVMADATGQAIELPVKSTYLEGLTGLEYFTATRGSRKGLISTALKTADSGYLTRRLVDVSQDVFITDDDCGDSEGTIINKKEIEALDLPFTDRIIGRLVADTVRDADGEVLYRRSHLISKEDAEDIDANKEVKEVAIRSAMSCRSLRGVCQKCYGIDLTRGEMVDIRQPVGVIAAQSIGEPGTQLTLSDFHAGGVAVGGESISQGLNRVEELFEARSPKGQAILAEIDGKVWLSEEGETYIAHIVPADQNGTKHKVEDLDVQVSVGDRIAKGEVLAKSKDKKVTTKHNGRVIDIDDKTVVVLEDSIPVEQYKIPAFKGLLVEDGQLVAKGERLTRGSMDLEEYMDLAGISAVQKYIMGEVQYIFTSQGQSINDKYIEIIVRQMFSRVQIDEPGDSPFVIGDIVSRVAAVEENNRLRAEGKEPATFTQLLLGITKVSTRSDSFLSAASFQDTTRVLIKAATSGSVDNLYGLKENVIIGRKIPVGTGYKGIDEE